MPDAAKGIADTVRRMSDTVKRNARHCQTLSRGMPDIERSFLLPRKRTSTGNVGMVGVDLEVT